MLDTLLWYHDYHYDNQILWLHKYEIDQYVMDTVFTWNDAMPSELNSVSIATRVIVSRGVLSWKDLQQPTLLSQFNTHQIQYSLYSMFICCAIFAKSAPSVSSSTLRLCTKQLYAVLSCFLNETLYWQFNLGQSVQTLWSWGSCFLLGSSTYKPE